MENKINNLVCGEGSVTATTGNKTQETLMEMKKMMDAYLDATSGNEKKGTGTCRMCGKHYENNAYPVVVDERCCDDCNMWVIVMRCWLGSNHDWLKDLIDGLLRNRINTGLSCINGENVAFTFYKDDLTKKLDVVVVCDDECIEEVVEGALRNWITDNCSEMNLEDVRELSKVGVWKVTNDIKIKEETECDEATVISTTSNEIFERLEKVFENKDFQVDIDTSTEVSTITILSNSDEYILIDIDDSFINVGGYDVDDNCCCEESVRWNPENDDVDDVYEDIKNAVSTVYAGITECRMREMFNEE